MYKDYGIRIHGIVLAGGTGSRLFPLTKVVNKHLCGVGPAPMIYHPLLKLIDAGIEDITVVSGSEHIGTIVEQLEDGEDLGCRITYKCQRKPGGIAEALQLCSSVVRDDEYIAVVLGDNIFENQFNPIISRYASHVQKPFNREDAMVVLKEMEDPTRYGVPVFGDEDQIVEFVEKPETPPSNYALTGLYLFPAFATKMTDNLEYSERGELEITELINMFIPNNLTYQKITGWWTDAGTQQSLKKANRLVWQQDMDYLKRIKELVNVV